MVKLIARVKNLMLSPKTEWDVIDAEQVVPAELATRYIAPLSALPALATVIGLSVLGVEFGGETYRAPIWGVLASAALFFALAIGGVFALAWVIDRIGPSFGSGRNYPQALKLSAYSITAAMLAGAVTIVPALGVIALMGAVYSLYVLFVGVPTLMKPAPESATNYSIVATACAVGISLAVGLAAMSMASVQGALFPQLASLRDFNVTDAILGAGEAETPPPTLGSGSAGVATAAQLKSAAPRRLAGFERVSVSVEAEGAPDAPSLVLQAEYRKGGRFIVLEIANSAAIAALIGFGGPATSEFDRETEDGYSRRRREGDVIVVEDWNALSKTGSHGRLVGETYYVKAVGGGGARPADLKAATEYFTFARLVQLASSQSNRS